VTERNLAFLLEIDTNAKRNKSQEQKEPSNIAGYFEMGRMLSNGFHIRSTSTISD
jgi:hypothetical protein